jgi:hypothetical protein
VAWIVEIDAGTIFVRPIAFESVLEITIGSSRRAAGDMSILMQDDALSDRIN